MHVHTHYGVGPHPFSIPKKPSSACADKEILTSGGLNLNLFTFSSVQFIHSVVSDSLQPHGLQLARLPCASPTSLSILFKLMSIKLVMPSNHLILCYPFLLLPPIPPSIRVFSNESTLCIRWQKYWSFSFSISPSNEYSELISFSIDWLDLLAVQETLKSLLQHRSSKASFLRARAQLLPLALSLEGLCENKT